MNNLMDRTVLLLRLRLEFGARGSIWPKRMKQEFFTKKKQRTTNKPA